MPNPSTQQLAIDPNHQAQELKIINDVADLYGLEGVARKLLFAVRQAENGPQGKEFGELAPEAMRFANDPDPMKSLKLQAMWAAGGIKKQFVEGKNVTKGSIKAWANRRTPVGAKNDPKGLNKNFLPNIMKILKAESQAQPQAQPQVQSPFDTQAASEERAILGLSEQQQRAMGGF